jgi:predicted DNA-binding protein (MmcQ/YjbR family)
MKPRDAFKALQKAAKACPDAWEDHPWGETVYKVGKKDDVPVELLRQWLEESYQAIAPRRAARAEAPRSPRRRRSAPRRAE